MRHASRAGSAHRTVQAAAKVQVIRAELEKGAQEMKS